MYLKIFYFLKKIFSKTFTVVNKTTYLLRNILKIIVLLIIIYTFVKLKGWC